MLHLDETIFLEAKENIIHHSEYSSKHKTKALFNLMTTIVEEVTQDEKIVFTTLFSRIAFMANKYKITPSFMYLLHTFRRDNERMEIPVKADSYVVLGDYLITNLLYLLLHNGVGFQQLDAKTNAVFTEKVVKVLKFRPVIEAIVDHVDTANFTIYFFDDEDGTKIRKAIFDQRDKNELFNDSVELLSRSFSFPLHVNLIDVEVLENGDYIPNAIVIEPDYLFDVTAVANCFKAYGTESKLRIVSKFKTVENSIPLTVGNVANMFLDEIISNPDVGFNDLLPAIFKLDPLGMSVFTDKQIRELVSKVNAHFRNLKKVVAVDLPMQGIKRDKVFLEPSFYSRDFGLQGRLDLFHYVQEKDQFDIVELKSGSPFRANVYGLSPAHYSQTLLYDLMIKSAFGSLRKPNSYILYSKIDDKNLKYAPPARTQQYEAMKMRNELLAIEHKMGKSALDASQLFEFIKPQNFEHAKGFELKDIQDFEKMYSSLDTLERAYFCEFASFICREHRMAKTGEHGINRSNGLSALWLENLDEKEERFALLKKLVIKDNKAQDEVPTIILERTEDTNSLANFRPGDIAVLYPYSEDPRAILKNQMFKCTILQIDEQEIEVKLRSKQYNDFLFKSVATWNIEEDSLDSGFSTLYRSLFEFVSSNKAKKELWLGKKSPRKYEVAKPKPFENLTAEQNELLNKMVYVKDYFLLWGPPGTGKTSVMLRSLVDRLYNETEETILLLAYTNRAVDEICAAIESIGEGYEELYMRIGSSTSCGEAYRTRLINHQIENIVKRDDIRKLLKSKRIYVSTVSSIVSRNALFKLKTFDRVIIDEASQILEPMLVGLLTKVKKAILIGDHKQLPAVVTQREEASKITGEELKSVGITDMRMSLFERLFYQVKKNEWNHAYGLLSYQGRMQVDLMAFPNSQFYEGNLHALPNIDRLVQGRSLVSNHVMGKILIQQRIIYIPTYVDEAFNWKTNKYESRKVLKVLTAIMDLYNENDTSIDSKSIGIITPYRAQIATIKSDIVRANPELLKNITVDTVERYQGGARDVIILSLCTNKLSQMRSLVSLSQEGVDRKLNVAVTRAREQLIIIGNKEILSANSTYKALIDSAFEWKV